MRQPDAMPRDLARAGVPAQLHDDVADLADTGCAHGMTFRFEAAAGVNRKPAGERAAPSGCIRAAFAFFHEAEIFTGDDFGDGEAIVQFRDFDIFGAESGQRVGFLRPRISRQGRA